MFHVAEIVDYIMMPQEGILPSTHIKHQNRDGIMSAVWRYGNVESIWKKDGFEYAGRQIMMSPFLADVELREYVQRFLWNVRNRLIRRSPAKKNFSFSRASPTI